MKNCIWILGTTLSLLLNCTSQLTVQDAQLALRIACESLATVLHAKHPESPPEAWQMALRACDVERTTKVMEVFLTHAPSSDGGSYSTTELVPIELAPLPPSFLAPDAGAP